jgi:hypothetical protein
MDPTPSTSGLHWTVAKEWWDTRWHSSESGLIVNTFSERLYKWRAKTSLKILKK